MTDNSALKKLWHDPVWSKVIAGLILAGGALVLAYFLNWWPTLLRAVTAAYHFLGDRTPVFNWLLALLVLVALLFTTLLIVMVRDLKRVPAWRSYTTDTFFNLRISVIVITQIARS